MVQVNISGTMAEVMRDSGKIIKCMEKVFINGTVNLFQNFIIENRYYNGDYLED